jgi:hypothetical protein
MVTRQTGRVAAFGVVGREEETNRQAAKSLRASKARISRTVVPRATTIERIVNA